MGKDTSIEWCDHTFNAWEGCTKVGPGCDNCYAETRNKRFHDGKNWGPGAPRMLRNDRYWKDPVRWNNQHEKFFAEHGRRQRVFASSLADVFDNEGPEDQRLRLFEAIWRTPNLDWLLLTKRIGNVMPMLERVFDKISNNDAATSWPWPNVWLGATVVNQAEADRDIPKLIATPARVRFLSIEPMLGPISLRWLRAWPDNVPNTALNPAGRTHHLEGLQKIDQVIVGGESGPGARPMHPNWPWLLQAQCAAAGVPFLFKQWGDWLPRSSCYHKFANGMSLADMDPGAEKWPLARLTELGNDGGDISHSGEGDMAYMQRVGKHVAGRLLGGMTHDGYPEVSHG